MHDRVHVERKRDFLRSKRLLLGFLVGKMGAVFGFTGIEQMALTLRPNDEQAAHIAALMVATKQATASKALLIAAAEYPAMQARIAELEAQTASDELLEVRRDLARLTSAIRDGKLPEAPEARHAVPDFDTVAADYLQTRDDLSEYVKKNWRTTLGYIAFGSVATDSVTVQDVADSVLPRWGGRRSVGSKMLSRVRSVFEYAVAKGLRADNPAEAARALLPKVKVQESHHHSFAPDALSGVLAKVAASDARTPAKLALRLAALTGARNGEVCKALRGEFDLDAKVWTVPAERMKASVEHSIPLSEQAVATVREAMEGLGSAKHGKAALFPGKQGRFVLSKELSDITRTLGTTVHGFRGTFKSWAIEQGYRREAAELALAHSIGLNATESAYVKTDLLAERRPMMQAWADFLEAGE